MVLEKRHKEKNKCKRQDPTDIKYKEEKRHTSPNPEPKGEHKRELSSLNLIDE